MTDPIGRRMLLRLAGAGLLGAAAAKAADFAAPAQAAGGEAAGHTLLVKGGKLFDVHKSLGNWIFLAPTKTEHLLNSRCTTL